MIIVIPLINFKFFVYKIICQFRPNVQNWIFMWRGKMLILFCID